MKKIFLNSAIISILTIGLTGCTEGNKASIPEHLYKPKKVDSVITYKKKPIIKNGVIYLPNNENIFDEEGDIKGYYLLNNEMFYLLKVKDKYLYKIKNSKQKVIKEFNATALSWFSENNKEMVLAVKLKGNNESGIYDNIYKFDGKNFKLINKNLDLGYGVYRFHNTKLYKYVSKSGMNYIETWYSKGSYLKKQVITNILTGKSFINNKIKTNYEYDSQPIFLGAISDRIYYIYTKGIFSRTNYIEVLNTKTNKVDTLLSDSENKRIQFLKAGNQIVLKIFNNPKLKSESIMFQYSKNFQTKYSQEPAKYISLNTLTEVNGVSEDFKPLRLFSYFEDITGGESKMTNITYTLGELKSSFNIKKRKIKPLF